jgi:integrase
MSARGYIRHSKPNRDGSVRWSLYIRRKGLPDFEHHFPEYTRPEDREKVEAAAENYRLAMARIRSFEAPSTETVTEWFKRYFDWRAARPVGGESVSDSRGRVKKWIAPLIGPIAIRDVTPAMLEALVGDLDDRVARGELAPKTAINAWGEVTAGFDMASTAKIASGLRALKSNPATAIRGPEKGITKAKPILRPDEVTRLLSCGGPKGIPLERRLVYAVAIYTAMRQGELRALRVRDVDFDAMQISVTKQLKGGKEKDRTKTGRPRPVTIEPNLLPLLKALTKGRPPDAFLLSVRAHNRCASNLREDLILAGCKREALHVPKADKQRAHLTFHNLRDTCLTHMAVRRDPPQDVQWRGGHTTATMTEAYIAQARYHAGPSFGVPLGPLPKGLIHPDKDGPAVEIEIEIKRQRPPKIAAK